MATQKVSQIVTLEILNHLYFFYFIVIEYQKNVGGVAFSLVCSIMDPMLGSMSNLIS